METNQKIQRTKIKRITVAMNEDVYDITVRKNHNFFANNLLIHNCVEIGMLPIAEDGQSGFQFCNLTEINGGMCSDKKTFHRACVAAAILGTLQAGYTNFNYLSDVTRKITSREALIGVSITGWMNNPEILFDETNMKDGAELVKNTNKEVASLLGINQAARTTCAKPSGNASVLLGTAQGIHGEHSKRYFRNVQMNDQDEVTSLISEVNPKMVEKSVWSSNGTDVVVSFPVIAGDKSVFKSDLQGVKQLEYVKLAQQIWVENGTNIDKCVDKNLRHNISNTISVDDWEEVEQYIFDNREYFAGISLLGVAGDKSYAQAPFTEVLTSTQIMETYGDAAMFASGLVIEALRAFNENLWLACDTAMGIGMKLSQEDSEDLLKRDFVRRLNKFAVNFFDGNKEKATFCLKDCYNLHKWIQIEKTMKFIDFSKDLSKQSYTDVDSLAGAACAGGQCEIVF